MYKSINQIEIKLGYTILSFQKQLWQFMRPELFFTTLKVLAKNYVMSLERSKNGKIVQLFELFYKEPKFFQIENIPILHFKRGAY